MPPWPIRLRMTYRPSVAPRSSSAFTTTSDAPLSVRTVTAAGSAMDQEVGNMLPAMSETITTETRGHVLLIGSQPARQAQLLQRRDAPCLRATPTRATRGRRRSAAPSSSPTARTSPRGSISRTSRRIVAAGEPLWPATGVESLGHRGPGAHQARRRRDAGARLHARHRARAGERRAALLRRRDLRAARDRARHLPVRRGHVPRARAARAGATPCASC